MLKLKKEQFFSTFITRENSCSPFNVSIITTAQLSSFVEINNIGQTASVKICAS